MSHQLVLNYHSLRGKFRLQSNIVHTFQREICRNDTFKLLLKTLLKEVFSNKGEILSCKSVKPCKNRKTQGCITSEQEINPVQIPHPSNATFKFPPSPGTMHSQLPEVCPGGMLKFRIDPRITSRYGHREAIALYEKRSTHNLAVQDIHRINSWGELVCDLRFFKMFI